MRVPFSVFIFSDTVAEAPHSAGGAVRCPVFGALKLCRIKNPSSFYMLSPILGWDSRRTFTGVVSIARFYLGATVCCAEVAQTAIARADRFARFYAGMISSLA